MIIRADARAIPLIDGCVDCVVTSPPYFGLRDYGHGEQIGLEPTPDAYVASLVAVFAEVWRVLKPEGTLWLNIGDSYAGSGKGGNPVDSPHQKQRTNRGSMSVIGNTAREAANTMGAGKDRLFRGSQLPAGFHEGARQAGAIGRAWVAPPDGYKQKDLIGIPWMLAFALRSAGWYLRSDVIWHKPNPMPESVTDRPTKSHEYLFLLSKSATYHYDADAIAEPVSDAMFAQMDQGYDGEGTKDYEAAGVQNPSGVKARIIANARKRADRFGGNKHDGATTKHSDGSVYTGKFTRNKRTVWTVPTMPYAGAHFATMPEKLVEPCILAGCPVGGLVFDPFLGSGTVGAVAARLGRRWVGTDLSYQDLAKARTAQRGIPFAVNS